MIERILVRYGDLTLKGKNKKTFINTCIKRIKERVQNDVVEYKKSHNRLYIILNGQAADPIIKQLKTVSGLAGFTKVSRSDKSIEAIAKTALKRLKHIKKPTTMKVETKRSDKGFPLTSQEISQQVASIVLSSHPYLDADVHHPDLTLNVEVREENAYVFTDFIEGMRGFPVGTMGKGIVLLSGGIDSPVAAYLSMVKGIEVELLHFESTPLTSIESSQKVIDIAKKLSRYGINRSVKLHLVPFLDIHQSLLEKVPDAYQITIMRRMMMRIAENFANKDFTPVLINGESIGQVASQTLDGMKITEMVTRIPVLRPLATMEKNAVINIARNIETYKISIRPFEDCCAVYTPKQPVTHPREMYALRYEKLFDYKPQIKTALKNIKTLTITPESDIVLNDAGFTVEDALTKED